MNSRLGALSCAYKHRITFVSPIVPFVYHPNSQLPLPSELYLG